MAIVTEIILKKLVDVAVNRLMENLTRTKARTTVTMDAVNDAVQHHIRDVKNWSADISFLDLKAPKRTEDAFIPLDLLLQPRRLRLTSSESVDVKPLDEVLADASVRHLIILGPPGAGKTTSVKHVCQGLLNDEDFLPGITFPILVRLRDLTGMTGRDDFDRFDVDSMLLRAVERLLGVRITFPELPTDVVEQQREIALRRQIRNRAIIDALEAMKVFLILDGFDELPTTVLRNAVIAELRLLVNQLESSRILITSRTGEFNFHLENTLQVEISPLSNQQILTFATRWLGKEHGVNVVTQIATSPYADTAIRPITIAHLCAVYERIGRIPDKPKTVYRKIVTLLLQEWDEQRSVTRESAYAGFDVDRKHEFLANLAYVLTTSFRRTAFSSEDLVLAYQAIYENFGLPEAQAQKVAREVESHSGLILQSGYDVYEFSHKSLQEYLTAEFIVRLPSMPPASELAELPNELAIAIAISSRPSDYLIQVVLERFKKEELPLRFVRTFISRLLLERPDFERAPKMAAALVGLNAQYTAAILNGPSALLRADADQVIRDLSTLVRIVQQKVDVSDVLDVFEIAEMQEHRVAGTLVRLQRRKGVDQVPTTQSRDALERELPETLWVSRAVLDSVNQA